MSSRRPTPRGSSRRVSGAADGPARADGPSGAARNDTSRGGARGRAGAARTATPSRGTASTARAGGSARPLAADRPEASPGKARAGSRPSGGTARGRPRRRVLRWGAPRDGEPRPTISLRALGLLLVCLVAFVVLAPTLRYAVTQQEELRSLNAEVAAAEERTAELESDLERWKDPEYVQSQARDRLGYVVPGETPYVVVDPESVVGEDPAAELQEERPVPTASSPWYLMLWQSIELAGEAHELATQESEP